MISGLCRSALELGAVSGAFAPAAMVDALGLDHGQGQLLWRELSAHVVEVLDHGSYGWMLTPDARLRQFKALVSQSGIKRLLEGSPDPWPDDDFGIALRRLLAGEAVTLDPLHDDEQDAALLTGMRRTGAILEAVQFVRHVAPLDKAAHLALEATAKRHIQEFQRRRDLTLVLPHKHRGYDAERRRLSRFLRGKTGDAQPVFLSGIGGTGKSALLARMFGYWQPRSDSPLTVVIDFDRRQLVSGEPVEILKEIFRQCATGAERKLDDCADTRALADGLRTLRRNLPERGAAGEERSFDSQISWLHTTTLHALNEDWAAPLRRLSIAVAFDSFEAVDRRGGGTIDLIFDLETMLREYLPNLRTVVSGRAHPLDPAGMERYFGPPERSVYLAGLAEDDGMALLADEDKRLAGPRGIRRLREKVQRRRLTGALSGHPLALLMLARFAHSRPEEIGVLTDDMEMDGGFQVEFAQTFLYERILDRIDDTEVRGLAHPGLILRAVNDDLIRLVLAKPCLGHEIDAVEAAVLRENLAAEYWLVESGDTDFPLHHRSDLRRLMVPGLLAQPRDDDSDERQAAKATLTSKARAICNAAEGWFRDGPPSGDPARARWQTLPDAVRDAHAYYYRGLADEKAIPTLTRVEAQDIRQELGDDLDTMPPAWRAPVKVLIGIQTDEKELATLDGELREMADAAIYDAVQAAGHVSSPIPEPQKTISTIVTDDTRSLADLQRRISISYARADFARVDDLGDAYAKMLRDDETGRIGAKLGKAMREALLLTPVWRIMLSKSALHGEEAARSFANAMRESDKAYNWTTFLFGVSESWFNLHSSSFDHPVDRLRWKRGLNVEASEMHAICPAALQWNSGNQLRDGKPVEWWISRELAKLLNRVQRSETYVVKLSELQSAVNITKSATSKYAKDYGFDVTRFGRVLRGLNPDLHEPLEMCLREAKQKTVNDILHELAKDTPLWPRELRFDARHPFSSRQAPTVVEIADELGRLDRLAALLGRTDPRALVVLRMYNLITDWFFADLPLERETEGFIP